MTLNEVKDVVKVKHIDFVKKLYTGILHDGYTLYCFSRGSI